MTWFGFKCCFKWIQMLFLSGRGEEDLEIPCFHESPNLQKYWDNFFKRAIAFSINKGTNLEKKCFSSSWQTIARTYSFDLSQWKKKMFNQRKQIVLSRRLSKALSILAVKKRRIKMGIAWSTYKSKREERTKAKRYETRRNSSMLNEGKSTTQFLQFFFNLSRRLRNEKRYAERSAKITRWKTKICPLEETQTLMKDS